MFLNEVEDIFEVMDPRNLPRSRSHCSTNWPNPWPAPTFRYASPSSVDWTDTRQVAERALYFWNNEYFCNLVSDNVETILPIMFAPLYENSKGHWNR